MCVTKDAVVIILDVGPSMCQAPPGHSTSLEISVKAVNMIIQRKVRINLCSTYCPLVVVSILCGHWWSLHQLKAALFSKALQITTVLVAMASEKYIWQPRFQLK